MKNKTLIIVLSVGMFLCFGAIVLLRANGNEVHQKTIVSQGTAFDSFKSHAQSAGRFWKLIESGKELGDQGRYGEALKLLEDAYENAAFGKIEKTIALDQMAQIYEETNDLKSAITFYEAAAQTAIHPLKQKQYTEKSQELRQKLALQPSA
jgi:tetratricopeptide (TPR) repeat protein